AQETASEGERLRNAALNGQCAPETVPFTRYYDLCRRKFPENRRRRQIHRLNAARAKNRLFTFMLEQLFSDVHADRVRSCNVLHPLTHFATTRWSLIRAEQDSQG